MAMIEVHSLKKAFGKNAVVALRNNDCKDIIVTPE